MRFLLEPEGAESPEALRAAAEAVGRSGLDGLLLAATPAFPAPLVAAAAVAAMDSRILVAAEVEIGDRHPAEIAEEAAVVDLASVGRLVLVVRPAAGVKGDFAEALDLLRECAAARPFRFAGRRWTVPARRPGNVAGPETARVTPAPFQPRLEVWGSGSGLEACVERGLGFLAGSDDSAERLAARWAAAAGPAATGAPRACRLRCESSEALVGRLRAGRAAFGQDWAVLLGTEQDAARVAREVRPRVQLASLPAELEGQWPQGASARREEAGPLSSD